MSFVPLHVHTECSTGFDEIDSSGLHGSKAKLNFGQGDNYELRKPS